MDNNLISYCGLIYSSKANNDIKKLCKDLNLNNRNRNIHTTIIFSRKYVGEIESKGDISIFVKAKSFKLFNFHDKKCLVLELDSEWINERFKFLKEKYNATNDFEIYIPHITLSYDYTETELPNESYLKDFNDLEIVNEYSKILVDIYLK